MAYNKKSTTTSTGKKIYYGGSLGEWDTDVEEEIVETAIPDTGSRKSKIIIWGAIIAAALYIFKK